jgi:Arc/MetJ-type ribon-helix-helix transcriptional regulator
MSVRDKIVTIRLTQEEYRRMDDLRAKCEMESISDLARTAIHLLELNKNGAGDLCSLFRSLQRQIHGLSSELDVMLEHMIDGRPRKNKDGAAKRATSSVS